MWQALRLTRLLLCVRRNAHIACTANCHAALFRNPHARMRHGRQPFSRKSNREYYSSLEAYQHDDESVFDFAQRRLGK